MSSSKRGDRDDSPRYTSSRGGDNRRRDYPASSRDDDRPGSRNGRDRRGYGGGDRERDMRSYGESDRERERQRDRERYDRGGERSARRSASPRRRSGSRSQSPRSVKTKPNFAASGLLAAETNTVKSVDGKNSTVLKYNEPPEARKPVLNWRLYVFKGDEQQDLMHISRQSAYLLGRDRLVADIFIDHPSCSKQHAAIQYRYMQEKDEFGAVKGSIKPFIIDLDSTNGTHVNGEAIPKSRYYELRASDVIKFGLSPREYVLLHDDA